MSCDFVLYLCCFSCFFAVHHFNLGRRVAGFDYGPDAFGTGLTPLHLSDDGEGGAFHFQEPPPPYAAYKYPDIQHPDDPPPPYEASVNPDSILFVDLGTSCGGGGYLCVTDFHSPDRLAYWTWNT